MFRLGLLALGLAVSSPALADDGNSGAWTYKAETPAEGGGFATALAPGPTVADFNQPAYIVARCLGGRTEFMVGAAGGGWGVTGHKVEVTTQADQAPPVTAQWDVSTNGKAAFIDDHVEDFLRTIPDAGKLRVSVKDPHGATFETIFDTSGFGPVRDKIAKACGWKQ